MERSKRLLAILLSVMMITTYMPTIAFAATEDGSDNNETVTEEPQDTAETEEAEENDTASEEDAEEPDDPAEAPDASGESVEEQTPANEAAQADDETSGEDEQQLRGEPDEGQEEEDTRVVESWSFSKKDGAALQIEEGTHGYKDTAEGNTFFRYYIDPEDLFENGDTVTVRYEGEDEDLTYTYCGWDEENGIEMEFVRETDDGLDRLEFDEFSLDSVQTDAWNAGDAGCRFTLKFRDVEYDLPFEIIANHVTSLAFERNGYDAETSPLELKEYIDGGWDYDADDSPWFCYNIAFTEGDRIILNEDEIYTLQWSDEYDENVFINEDGDAIPEYEIAQESNSSSDPWEPGNKYNVTLSYNGVSCEVAVRITANPVSKIDFERPGLEDGDGIEVPQINSQDEEDYSFNFEYGDILRVTYLISGEETEVSYVCVKKDIDEGEWEQMFEAQGEVPDGAEEVISVSNIRVSFYSSEGNEPETWALGEVHDIECSYMGKTCTIPVKLVESDDPQHDDSEFEFEEDRTVLPGWEDTIRKYDKVENIRIVGSHDTESDSDTDFGDDYSALLESFEYREDENDWFYKAGDTYGTVTFEVTYVNESGETDTYTFDLNITSDVYRVYLNPVNGSLTGTPGTSIEFKAEGHRFYMDEGFEIDSTDNADFDYRWEITEGADLAVLTVDQDDHSLATLTFTEPDDISAYEGGEVGVKVEYFDKNNPDETVDSAWQYADAVMSCYQIAPAKIAEAETMPAGHYASGEFGLYKYEYGQEPELIEDAQLTFTFEESNVVLVNHSNRGGLFDNKTTLKSGDQITGTADLDIYRITGGSAEVYVAAEYSENDEYFGASTSLAVDGPWADGNLSGEMLYDDADGFVTLDLSNFGEDWADFCDLELEVGLWDGENESWLKTYRKGTDYTVETSDDNPGEVSIGLKSATLKDAINTAENPDNNIRINAAVNTKKIDGNAYPLWDNSTYIQVLKASAEYNKEEDRELLAGSGNFVINKNYDYSVENSEGTTYGQYTVTDVSFTETPDEAGRQVLTRCEKVAEEGNADNYWWEVEAGDPGTAEITVTYEDPLDNNASKSYTFTVTVTDEAYEVWVYTNNEEYVALPGKSITVYAGANHKRAGQEDTTEGITYAWSVDRDDLATVVPDPEDPSKATVTFVGWDELEETGGGFWLDVNVTATIYDGEDAGGPIERKKDSKTLCLSSEYVELAPASIEGLADLAVGGSKEVRPALMQYNHDNENGIDITTDDIAFKWTYNSDVVEIKDANDQPVGNYTDEDAYIGSTAAQTFTITRLTGDWDNIALEAVSDDNSVSERRWYELNYIEGEHAHNFIHGDEVTANCVQSGNLEYWYCDMCGKYFSDEAGENEVTWEELFLPSDDAAHDWGDVVYTWADDDSSVSATRTCINSPAHTETVTQPTSYNVITEATEEEEGEGLYTAEFEVDWAETQTKPVVIPVSGHKHSLTHIAAKPETCTGPGNTEYWICDGCGKYFSDENGDNEIDDDSWVIPAAGHLESLPPVSENIVAATCTEDGSYDEIVYCARCHEELSRETKPISASGHTWDAGTVTKEATEAEEGEKTYTCTVCGETRTEAIPKITHQHNPGEAVIENETAATCEEHGSYDEVVYCSICGEELNRVTRMTQALGHEWSENWLPNDEDTHKKVCANDPTHVQTESHDWSFPYIDTVREGNCSETRLERWECPVCGGYKMYEGATDPNRHNWTNYHFEWADDYSTVTGSVECANNPEHNISETVSTTSEIITEPTAETTGEIVYRAEFESNVLYPVEEYVTIPKLASGNIIFDGDEYANDREKALFSDSSVTYLLDADIPAGGRAEITAGYRDESGRWRLRLEQGNGYTWNPNTKKITLSGPAALAAGADKYGYIDIYAKLIDSAGSAESETSTRVEFIESYERNSLGFLTFKRNYLITGETQTFDATGWFEVLNSSTLWERNIHYDITDVSIKEQNPASGQGEVISIGVAENTWSGLNGGGRRHPWTVTGLQAGTAVLKVDCVKFMSSGETENDSFEVTVYVEDNSYVLSVTNLNSGSNYENNGTCTPGSSVILKANGIGHIYPGKYGNINDYNASQLFGRNISTISGFHYSWEIVKGDEYADISIDQDDPSKATIQVADYIRQSGYPNRVIIRTELIEDETGAVRDSVDYTLDIVAENYEIYVGDYDIDPEPGESFTITPELRHYTSDNPNKYDVVENVEFSCDEESPNQSATITQPQAGSFTITRNGMRNMVEDSDLITITATYSVDGENGTETGSITRNIALYPVAHTISFINDDDLYVDYNKSLTLDLDLDGLRGLSPELYTIHATYGSLNAKGKFQTSFSGVGTDYIIDGDKLTIYGDRLQSKNLDGAYVRIYVISDNKVIAEDWTYVRLRSACDAGEHEWETTYEWNTDIDENYNTIYTSVTATAVCAYDSSHTMTETADCISEYITEPDCTTGGEVRYSHKPFTNPVFEQQEPKTRSVYALDHKWGEPEITWSEHKEGFYVRPDCSVYVHVECERCDEAENRVYEADYTVTKAPTTTEEGEIEYSHDFEGLYGLGVVTHTAVAERLSCDHQMTKTEAVEPGCVDPGYKAYWTCSVCGNKYSDEYGVRYIYDRESIAAIGHTQEYVGEKQASCTEEGCMAHYECFRCGQCFSIGYHYPSWEMVINECERDFVYTAKTPHKEVVIQEGKEATCTEPGLTDRTQCSVCNQIVQEQEEIPARGHSWSEWTVTTEPSLDAEGEETRECSVCHEKETRSVPKLDHEHKLVKTEGRAATCTVDGNSAYWTCSACEKYFSDAEGKTEIGKDSWVISAEGHKWNEIKYAANDYKTSVTASHKCTVCGTEESETVAVTSAVTKATCENAGKKVYTSNAFENPAFQVWSTEEQIPKLGHEWNEPAYLWSADNTTVTATCTCKNDPSHTETETVNATSAVTKEATSEEEGVRKWTSGAFANRAFTVQTKEESIPKVVTVEEGRENAYQTLQTADEEVAVAKASSGEALGLADNLTAESSQEEIDAAVSSLNQAMTDAEKAMEAAKAAYEAAQAYYNAAEKALNEVNGGSTINGAAKRVLRVAAKSNTVDMDDAQAVFNDAKEKLAAAKYNNAAATNTFARSRKAAAMISMIKATQAIAEAEEKAADPDASEADIAAIAAVAEAAAANAVEEARKAETTASETESLVAYANADGNIEADRTADLTDLVNETETIATDATAARVEAENLHLSAEEAAALAEAASAAKTAKDKAEAAKTAVDAASTAVSEYKKAADTAKNLADKAKASNSSSDVNNAINAANTAAAKKTAAEKAIKDAKDAISGAEEALSDAAGKIEAASVLGDLSEASGTLSDAETIAGEVKTGFDTVNTSKTVCDSTYSTAKTTADNANAALRKAEEQAKNDYLDWNGTQTSKVPAAKSVKAKAAKKKVTVRWKKLDKKNLKKFNKVEIQVCTDKGFAKANTIRKEVGKSKKSVKIKLKSKKTYYVRVRNVKGSGTTKLVSKWSKPKKIKIK